VRDLCVDRGESGGFARVAGAQDADRRDPHRGAVAPHLVVVGAGHRRREARAEVVDRGHLAESAAEEPALLPDELLGPHGADLIRRQVRAVRQHQPGREHRVLGVVGAGRVVVDEVGHPPVPLGDLRPGETFGRRAERVAHRLADESAVDALDCRSHWNPSLQYGLRGPLSLIGRASSRGGSAPSMLKTQSEGNMRFTS
jgi:hypothetical protein